MSTPHAALFLKAPRPGTVKTRLATSLGAERATALYRIMAERAAGAVQGAGWRGTVWFDPPGAGAEMRAWLGDTFAYQAQPGGDLGARLARAVEHHQREVVLLGGDCPGLTSRLLAEAAALLQQVPVVLGPAADGGYYLLGIRGPAPDLFAAMPWSTSGLLEATKARLRALGVEWGELSVLRDVDTLEDAVMAGLVAPEQR
jgi:rSAM/selenodomain-associated transferase 1